ncbi:MAG: glycine betaine ABC transporter substrate-binding protein [Acidimicrobiia bacterium]|jgi:glycine betaine/proline transport system substrate-binding protein
MQKKRYRLLALLAVLAMVVAACSPSGSSDTTEASSTDDTEASTDTTEAEMTDTTEGEMMMPGEGVTVNMGRADWSTGYFQAYVYQALLQELGYDVTDPSELELGPSLAYLGMAQGDFDFWVNSWIPGHLSWLEPELPDGSQVGDHVKIFGPTPAAAGDYASAFVDAPGEMVAGGLQGFLITKSFADEYGVTTMDQLNNDPDILAAFDAADPEPGNGIADIYGCQESFTCDNIITNQIAFGNGEQPWDNIQQVIAGYDAMVAEALAKVENDEPMVIYTWTPSSYITQLIPGDNVVWLGVEAVLDDSNPSGQDGGESHDQRPGTANIGPDQCPSAADMGTCQVGWIVADILVTANSDFVDANPAAAKLFELVSLSVIDVSLANVAQSGGADTNEAIQGLAADWIAENRDMVDGWLAEAAAAG